MKNNNSKKILYTNCNIYNQPNTTSILCENGKIKNLIKDKEKIGYDLKINLKNGWVYPGFTDSHIHLTGLGFSLNSINIAGFQSKNETTSFIKSKIKNKKDNSWIQGRGWDQNNWKNANFPTANDLDKIIPNNPAIFKRIDGHALWANSLAMKKANVSRQTKEIKGGIILRDKNGRPSGIFIDNAMKLIESKIPKPTKMEIKKHIKTSQQLLNKLGITSVHDAGTSINEIKVLKSLIKEKRLTIRVYTMLNNDVNDYRFYLKDGPEINNDFLKVRAIKIYLDGALGSRGAALLEPYSDEPKNKGLLLMNLKKFRKIIKEFNNAGFQVNTHGIGDRAVNEILNCYEDELDKNLRNRIEHAQIVQPDDIKRFKTLKIIPAIQATHCTSDMNWIKDRLGEKRLNRAYPWRKFLDNDVITPGGSDSPIESANPLEGIYASITRQDKNGLPKNGWYSDQKMTLDEAIKSYTEWPAYASFEDDLKGKIKIGYYGDFTVLDSPLKQNKPLNILKTKVTFTIVNGQVVYKR